MRCLFLPLAALTVFLLPAPAIEPEPELNLIVIEGEGATNNIRLRTAREPIVQVEDENHKPIAGATVVFTLPAQGAGGSFANGAQTLMMRTDKAGRAIARGFHSNKIQGQFQIHVNASFQGQTASLAFTQTNAVIAGAAGAAAGISAKLLIILAVAGAATAGGVVAATHSGGSSNSSTTQPPTIPTGTIGAGSGTVFGPPH
jgi:hypothetical protein